MGLLEIVWMNFEPMSVKSPLAQGLAEFSVLEKLGMKWRPEDLGVGGLTPLRRISSPGGARFGIPLQLNLTPVEFSQASGNLLRIFSSIRRRKATGRAA
jgi:hypothetical protein